MMAVNRLDVPINGQCHLRSAPHDESSGPAVAEVVVTSSIPCGRKNRFRDKISITDQMSECGDYEDSIFYRNLRVL